MEVIWKSDQTDKKKRSFFQAAVVSIQLYGWTTIYMDYMDANKTDGEKAWRQLHKNAASNVE